MRFTTYLVVGFGVVTTFLVVGSAFFGGKYVGGGVVGAAGGKYVGLGVSAGALFTATVGLK